MGRVDPERPRTSDFLVTSKFLFNSTDEAIAALASIGAPHDPRLDLSVLHDVLGGVHRRFGVMRNVLELGPVANNEVAEVLRRTLADYANDDVREEMARRRFTFTPVNKRVLQDLLLPLHRAGLHLPWSFWPMNYDLAGRMCEVYETRGGLPFEVFYSQIVDLYPGRERTGGLAKVGRMYSLPISMSAHGTWQETVLGQVDVDVGLVVEANVRT